jgi:hypothetical protein
MPTAKPRYIGNGTGNKLSDFSIELRGKLREFYPDKNAEEDPVWGHPADTFVSHILNEAWWAKSELHWLFFEGTKAELRAEHNDLLSRVTELENRMRNISSDFDRLLGNDADPLGCAEKLAELARNIERAGNAIGSMPRAKRPDEKQHYVAVELAIRVLNTLKGYGIKPAATGDAYFGYTSDAIRILKLIADDIKLILDELTWRDIVIEAKAAETHPRSRKHPII